MTEETTRVTLEAPSALTFSEEEMRSERPARLLDAGEYPDRGLTVTEDDLDGIVARFSADLPVKVEHVDSPLDPVGRVRRVWRAGRALFGTLAFPDDLAAFLRRRGAAGVSVGLTRDPLTLAEVSLVLRPRVPTATLMSQNVGEGVKDAEIVRLRAALAAREVDAQIAGLKAQGRIVPASEALARALLSLGGEATVTLSDGPAPAADVFRRFLLAQPPAVLFGEAAPSGTTADEHGFTQDEHTFLSRRLGVDPVRVASLLRGEGVNDETAAKTVQKEAPHAH